jgi:DNA-binding Xre family transcriptional regulator
MPAGICLSPETRAKIKRIIREENLSSSDLRERFGLGKNTISKLKKEVKNEKSRSV